MIDYKGKPFYLDDAQIRWVEETWDAMTLEERIGQLFCPIGYSSDQGYLKHCMLDKHPGGIMFRTAPQKEIFETYSYLQKESRIPLFLPANLESGGDGIAEEGTAFGKQMQVAATQDPVQAYRLGKVCCREGKAVGCNFAFAPVVDIDRNFHNPITNVRTYGSDAETVIRFAREYQKAAREEGMITSIKHFPGDGVDERDQHILTSVNELSCEEWDESYGRVYRTLIDEGALSVMVGHIALPSYQKKYDPDADGELIPASLSKVLLQKLLREKLQFNGMIITDATPMVGFCCAMERREAVPAAIEAGCDMFLFNKDYDEDYQYMMEGYREGRLSKRRLEEAVKRILALKAAVGLPQKKEDGTICPGEDGLKQIGCEEHRAWAGECASKSVTLVKDTQQLLPLSPEKHKKVLYQILGDCASNGRVEHRLVERMSTKGFQMIPYQREVFDFTKPLPFDTVEQFKQKYDLVLYVGNIENASNKTTNRINWYTLFGLGNNMPWFVKEVPTLFLSLQNPYHLLDVPMIKTYINAYSNHNAVIDAAVEKMTGQEAFTGVSPVDPFCGKEYLRL